MPAQPSDNQDRAFVNQNFLVKVYYDGKPGAELTGAGQLQKLFGSQYKDKIFAKAFSTQKQEVSIRIRDKKATVKLISR
ncbi:hypothetical protein SAMN05216480_12336 [Pustulibacterium marinum]|uniref:Uncharacterized protein n=1 Tax=Pustulibacterium marinum TaxID=1224947 RepID=A0A1I7IWH3_9FLAO|nr:hypothetical protein [Pustulibacterium marinum]SFU77273.1 hypothetical protein SAMN05216480_12336 [Pustulibacterium marinum]